MAIVTIAMVLAPFVAELFAAFVSFVAFVGPVPSLAAVWPKMFDGLVVPRIGVGDSTIAIIPSIRICSGRADKEKKTAECQNGERGLAEKRRETQSRKFHKSLEERARAGFGMTS